LLRGAIVELVRHAPRGRQSAQHAPRGHPRKRDQSEQADGGLGWACASRCRVVAGTFPAWHLRSTARQVAWASFARLES